METEVAHVSQMPSSSEDEGLAALLERRAAAARVGGLDKASDSTSLGSSVRSAQNPLAHLGHGLALSEYNRRISRSPSAPSGSSLCREKPLLGKTADITSAEWRFALAKSSITLREQSSNSGYPSQSASTSASGTSAQDSLCSSVPELSVPSNLPSAAASPSEEVNLKYPIESLDETFPKPDEPSRSVREDNLPPITSYSGSLDGDDEGRRLSSAPIRDAIAEAVGAAAREGNKKTSPRKASFNLTDQMAADSVVRIPSPLRPSSRDSSGRSGAGTPPQSRPAQSSQANKTDAQKKFCFTCPRQQQHR